MEPLWKNKYIAPHFYVLKYLEKQLHYPTLFGAGKWKEPTVSEKYWLLSEEPEVKKLLAVSQGYLIVSEGGHHRGSIMLTMCPAQTAVFSFFIIYYYVLMPNVFWEVFFTRKLSPTGVMNEHHERSSGTRDALGAIRTLSLRIMTYFVADCLSHDSRTSDHAKDTLISCSRTAV